jgi:hypothetical protein
MKRSTRNVLGNPFLAWADLAWKIGEMSVASAQVIARRTTRMAAAGPMPNARNRQEFTRMGEEKIEAATESARAIAAHLTTMNLEVGARAFRHMLTGTAALMSLAASRSVGQSITRQAKLAQTLSRSAITASELFDSTARLARRGLKPIHARATANARRLGKR